MIDRMQETPEPLYLPSGSIRALVTLSISIACWTVVFSGRDIPEYLFALVLTLLGYYFGYRKKSTQQEQYSPVKQSQPLFLPKGIIRFVLIMGFIVSGLVAFSRFMDNMDDAARYVQLKYFGIVWGLIFGYFFAALYRRRKAKKVRSGVMLHIKGLLVIVVTILLSRLLIMGKNDLSPNLIMPLLMIISLYFGSR